MRARLSRQRKSLLPESLPALAATDAPDAVMQLLQINPVNGELIAPSADPLIVRALINELARRMLALPPEQQLNFALEHIFCEGMYLRKMFIPKGSLLVGQVHKLPCLNLVCKGDIAVMTETGSARVGAGYTVASPAGTQKLGFAHSDTVFVNIFRTDLTDLAAVEAEIAYIPEPDAHDVDRLDFCAFMHEYGLSEDYVEAIVADMSDHIDLPDGIASVYFATSAIHASGTFASHAFAGGQTIAPARMGRQRTLVGRLTNHAKQPNCRFADDGQGGLLLVAAQDIAANTELTIDYRQAARINVSLGLQPQKELS